uniref:Uncharacterized protein n=1 Tax=Ditylum brightwellii TaxID=49249 RepID=A0A7S1ZJS3_9STRA
MTSTTPTEPNTIHKLLSTILNTCLNYLPTSFVHAIVNIDTSILVAVQIGVTLGLGIVTFLSFFPGEPLNINYGDDTKTTTVNNIQHQNETTTDVLTPQQRSKLQTLCGLSDSQMDRVLQSNEDKTFTTTIVQKLDWMVYGVLIGVFVYVVNRDYDGAFRKWFVATFPREADTLGMMVI